MRLRRTWPAALLLLVPALTGCSDDDPGASDDPMTESPSTPASGPSTPATETTSAATETTSAAPTSALPATCDIVTSADLAKQFSLEFGDGQNVPGTFSSNDLEWTSDGCRFEAAGVVEVTVAVTGPDDFTQGEFSCAQPGDVLANVEPVDDIAGADEAWWRVKESPPLEALMRACSATANVDISLEYEDGVDYEGDPRNQSAALAGLVLSNLEG